MPGHERPGCGQPRMCAGYSAPMKAASVAEYNRAGSAHARDPF
jgi:hypothetical protein